jgi:hypothetical protein
MKWKAIRRDDGSVLWEARRVLESFGSGPMTMKYATKRVVPAMAAYWKRFGFDDDDCRIVPNHRMLQARGLRGEADDRDEQQFTTLSLLLLLLGGADSENRRGEPRRVSEACLTAFCEHQLPEGVLDNDRVKRALDFRPLLGARCLPSSPITGCRHEVLCRGVLATIDARISPQKRVASLLLSLPRLLIGCPAMMPNFRDFVRGLAECIDIKLAGMREYDPLTETFVMNFRSDKKRRMDEDTKRAVLEVAIKARRARSVGAWASSAGGSSSTVFSWRSNYLADYYGSAWHGFEGTRTLHLTADGARAGEPPKEYMFGAAWSSNSERAAWLKPAVHLGYML